MTYGTAGKPCLFQNSDAQSVFRNLSGDGLACDERRCGAVLRLDGRGARPHTIITQNTGRPWPGSFAWIRAAGASAVLVRGCLSSRGRESDL